MSSVAEFFTVHDQEAYLKENLEEIEGSLDLYAHGVAFVARDTLPEYKLLYAQFGDRFDDVFLEKMYGPYKIRENPDLMQQMLEHINVDDAIEAHDDLRLRLIVDWSQDPHVVAKAYIELEAWQMFLDEILKKDEENRIYNLAIVLDHVLSAKAYGHVPDVTSVIFRPYFGIHEKYGEVIFNVLSKYDDYRTLRMCSFLIPRNSPLIKHYIENSMWKSMKAFYDVSPYTFHEVIEHLPGDLKAKAMANVAEDIPV